MNVIKWNDKMIKNRIIFFVIVGIVLVSGCAQNTKGNAEAVAQGFAIDLQNSNYETLYELFTPELKKQRSKENFVRYISGKGSPLENSYFIFDKVVMQGDNEAYAYYTLSGGILESKMPPIPLVFTSEGWRIDGFVSYFTEGCLSDYDCESNRQEIVAVPTGVVSGELSNSEYESNRLRCNKNFECVECISNSDCKDSQKPHCESTLSHICFECFEDSHCPSNKPICSGFECMQCRISSDCPSDKPRCIYSLEQHTYVCSKDGDAIECWEDKDCPNSKPYCDRSDGYFDNQKCIECKSDLDCKAGYICGIDSCYKLWA